MDSREAESNGLDDQHFGFAPLQDLDGNTREGDLCQFVLQARIPTLGEQGERQNRGPQETRLPCPLPLHQAP